MVCMRAPYQTKEHVKYYYRNSNKEVVLAQGNGFRLILLVAVDMAAQVILTFIAVACCMCRIGPLRLTHAIV